MEAAQFPHSHLTDDLRARDWQEYIDACFCHDHSEPVVCHARDLAHSEDVLAMTASTT